MTRINYINYINTSRFYDDNQIKEQQVSLTSPGSHVSKPFLLHSSFDRGFSHL